MLRNNVFLPRFLYVDDLYVKKQHLFTELS
jgi:hypothetical protein